MTAADSLLATVQADLGSKFASIWREVRVVDAQSGTYDVWFEAESGPTIVVSVRRGYPARVQCETFEFSEIELSKCARLVAALLRGDVMVMVRGIFWRRLIIQVDIDGEHFIATNVLGRQKPTSWEQAQVDRSSRS